MFDFKDQVVIVTGAAGNLATEDLRPADGVYAAIARLEEGRRFPAAVNIGSRPTFAGVDHRVEDHLMMEEGAAPAR